MPKRRRQKQGQREILPGQASCSDLQRQPDQASSSELQRQDLTLTDPASSNSQTINISNSTIIEANIASQKITSHQREEQLARVTIKGNKTDLSGANVAGGNNYNITKYTTNHYNSPNTNSDSTSDNVSLETIKEDLKKPQQEVVPLGLNYEQDNFPCVHPVLRKEKNFYLGSAGKTEKYKPSTQQRDDFDSDDSDSDEISVEQWHNSVVRKRYTALVGAPGSGKSTIARRLSKNTSCIIWILLLCMDMHYGSEKVTLRQVVVDHAYPWLSESQRNAIFAEMMKFPEKFGIIFDGYDQATWSLDNVNPRNASYDTPMLVEKVVANLCSGKFLPGISIVLTSRPHSIVTLHEVLRPKEIVFVHELTPDNMKKLFFAFAQNEAQRIWNSFTKLVPVLLELCLTPIMLQLILLAALGTDNVTELCNITQIFTVLLENLRRSEHAKGRDINLIKVKFSKIAYNATKNLTVIMTYPQMVEERLSDVIVQDIVIAVPGYSHFNQKLFDGDKKFYFSHQTLQEFFTALHISQNMSLDEFSQIVKKLVSDPHWAMVRRFLCGSLLFKKFTVKKETRQQTTAASGNLSLTLDGTSSTQQVANQPPATPPATQPSQLETRKATMFYEHFLQEFKRNPRDIGMIVDLQECNEGVLQSFAKHFPVKAYFSGQPIGTSSAHALGQMLQHVDKPMEWLGLESCKLTSQGLEHICEGIGKMRHKLKQLKLSKNHLGNVGVQHLSKIVDKVEVLLLFNCDITDISELTEAIENKQCKLKKLNLNNNHLGNVGVQHLSKIVDKVEMLRLESCDITDISELTEAIENKQCKLKQLNLSKNHLGNVGVQHLSKIVDKVEVLWLSSCDITDISELTEAIENKQCKIKVLNLRVNRIGDEGARKLSRVLTNIEELRVYGCDITDEDKEVFRSKLRELGLPEDRVKF